MDQLTNLGVLLLIIIHAVAFWYVVNKLFKRPRNLPPGPFRLPIIGNLHNLISKTPHKSIADLAKIHGPLMSLKLGSLTTIVASSPSTAQLVLQKHDLVFSNRWVPDVVHAHRHNDFSMAFLPNNLAWRNLRKICITQLFSNKSLDASQQLRHKKVEELLSYIHGCCQASVAVNIAQAVFSSNLNLISNTFFSMDLTDPDSTFCREFKELVWQVVLELGKPNLGDFFPVLKGLDIQRSRRRMENNYGKMITFFQKLIDERLAKGIDPTTESDDDVLDALLKINQEKEEFEMPYIMHSIVDLFIGGTETTSSTIEWVMTELLRNRSKLKKAQEELHTMIGRGNRVKEADTTRLPYLQAVVKETLRLHPPLPFLVPRVASEDVELCGFMVPKDSQVLVNVWAIGRDPCVWERPSCFEPERFLGSNIDIKGLHFELTPFGSGRRYCPGLPLASRNLHLILGSLIHSFDWKLEDGVDPESVNMDEKFGIGVQKAEPLIAVPVSF